MEHLRTPQAPASVSGQVFHLELICMAEIRAAKPWRARTSDSFCRTPDPNKRWQCVSRTNPLFRSCSLLGFALLIWKQPGSTLTCGFLFSSHRCRCRHLVALRPLGRPHLASPQISGVPSHPKVDSLPALARPELAAFKGVSVVLKEVPAHALL